MALVPQVIGAVRGAAARSIMQLPRPVLTRLAGAPVVVAGRTLDPEMQLLLKLQHLEGPAAESVSISRGRRIIVSSSRLAGGNPPIGAVTDRTIDGPGGPLRLRFYTPRGLSRRSPALLFFHGGGWIYGDLESHDATCRFLAEEAQVRVVAVDYRLAPEAPFPAAVDDAMAAWAWIAEHAQGLGIDPTRIAVGGDSAGGNLAAVVAQQAVAAGGPTPAFQLLIYPATDFAERAPSRDTYAEGFFLTRAFMDLAEENYLVGGEDRSDPRLSPLHGDVTGVAPAYVVTAGFDPLIDEGDAYAEKLRAAGVPVEHVTEDGLIHGFINMVSMGRTAPRAARRAAAALQRGLS
ncbi:alpha/beta hydrolase [Aeromicrobium sp. CFBP 8757]|uniref:alpha/beta hydrolase n=1 Tax=Aeromicrobium sp. CFBP 8757 TaxID=2775288 RepID=UPI0017862E8F|nr:alpha/beta hydrolase [Aeromicrobium sp. CFBP 8757]MBD8606761.1 alpha/beta hydrolase [Aeromicrobium sp. CFBP 8757]